MKFSVLQYFWFIVIFASFPGAKFIKQIVLYDDIFEKQLQSISSDASYHNVKFQKVTNRSNLLNITKWTFDQSRVIFSFTAATPSFTEENYFGFSTSLNNLKEQLKDSLHYHCMRNTKTYEKVLISLIHSLTMRGIAFLSDETSCSIALTNNIYQQLLQKNTELNLYKIHYSGNPSHQKVLSNHFYSLKTAEVTLIVLLASKYYIPDVLRKADEFGLTSSSHIWIIPNYYDGVSTSFIPTRILTFDFVDQEETGIYKNLNRTIPKMIQTYDKYLAACRRNSMSLTECMKPYLYMILNNKEHISRDEHILSICYQSTLDNATWLNLAAVLKKDRVLIDHNTLGIFRSASRESIQQFMRVVTIFDTPHVIEETSVYESDQKSCKAGLICRKPIKSFSNNTEWQQTCCVGFVIDLFQKIMEELHIEIDIYIVADGKYGALENGRWNGMIADVYEGKADIAVASVTISQERSNYVDFSAPFLEQNMGILYKPEIVELKFINWDFMSPLSTELQLMLWLIIVGMMVLNYVFQNDIYALSLADKRLGVQKYYPTFESMSYIAGVTLQRDLGGVNPKRLGARIPAICFAFGMVIVVTTYTAVLAAQSVQSQEKDPFKGSKDVRMRNPTDNFRFGTLKSSSYETFFKHGETDVLKRMSVFMNKYNVKTTHEGFNKTRNGSLNAFISGYMFLYYYLSKDQSCELRLMKDPLLTTGQGFAIKKNMDVKILIDRAIMKLIETEIVIELQKKWFPEICQPSSSIIKKVKLSINHFGGLILLLFSTMILSAPLLLPEFIYYKYFQNYITKKIQSLFGKTSEFEMKHEQEERRQTQNKVRLIDEISSKLCPSSCVVNRNDSSQSGCSK